MQATVTNATSFSSAAVATVQPHGYTSAFIPRFNPSGGAQWNGMLTRFALFSEFASGCTSADYGVQNARNPNGNNSCTDIFLTDQNNKFIVEANGQFALADTTKPWDGGWPAQTGADGGAILATPMWAACWFLAAREDSVMQAKPAKARGVV